MTEPSETNGPSLIILYTTLPTEKDAAQIGRRLVEERLAGCVNVISNITSIYRWQDTIETAGETALFVKTTDDKKDLALRLIKDLHPYETPALLTLRPESVNEAYLDWLRTCTRANHGQPTPPVAAFSQK